MGAVKSHRTSKMSNLLVNQIEEGSEAGKNSRGDGHNIRPVSIKMLEISEKLETLNKECQILNVENKGIVDISIRVVFTILKYHCEHVIAFVNDV